MTEMKHSVTITLMILFLPSFVITMTFSGCVVHSPECSVKEYHFIQNFSFFFCILQQTFLFSFAPTLPVLQGSMGSITCIAWKGDTLVLGDVDGNLNFWDLKARLSR